MLGRLLLILMLPVFFNFEMILVRRFQYKHSFKRPHLLAKDGRVPFFDVSGDAIASDESVRLVPSLRSKRGAIWNRIPASYKNFEIEMSIRISGRGRLGADGLALWFTEQRGMEGPVFGSNDQWNGLGILFDSYDNDGRQNNPYISAVVNDGTMKFDHAQDGSTQEIAGCQRDFRNRPRPVQVRLTFLDGTLTLRVNSGVSADPLAFEHCFAVSGIVLPTTGYFGVSAATGGLADDHDVLSLLVFELAEEDAEEIRRRNAVEADEAARGSFKQKNEELERERKQYKEENPEDRDEEEEYEETSSRDLRNILDANDRILHHVGQVSQRVNEMFVRQDGLLKEFRGLQQQLAGAPPQGGPGGPPPAIQRFDVDQLLAASRESLAQIANVHNQLQATEQRLIQQQARLQGGGSDNDKTILELLNGANNRLQSLADRPVCAPVDQAAASCLTTTWFITLLLLQTMAFIGFMVFKSSQEAKAKKFY